jgi:NodT family efflux transporter outer membrane factor (OMF) lipoprotein
MAKQRALVLFVVVVAAATLSQCGCTPLMEYIHNGFKVGPNYHQPPVPLPQDWIDSVNPRVVHGDPNLCSWWDVFDDPILTKLLHDAFANNLTLRAAGVQILEAEQSRCLAIGQLFPQAQRFNAQYTRNMISLTGGTLAGPSPLFGAALAPPLALVPPAAPNTPIAGITAPDPGGTTTATNGSTSTGAATAGVGSGPRRFFSNISTSLNASWEVDFWGLFRRNLEAANASLDQSVQNYDEMLVLLLADVATEYVQIRTLQRRLELARSNVALQEPLVAIYERRYKEGIANAYPGYQQLLSNLENTRALIPTLEILLREANNKLCVLLGMPVQDLLPQLGDGTVPDPTDPTKRSVRIPRPVDYSVVVGIPGKLLLRRPDVQAAEDQLRIQTAQIGIADAELYPHIGFNGTIGLASDSLKHLFDINSWAGSIGPSLSWNILNYGRLLSNLRFQDFLLQQFVLTYQQAILNANQDVENALVAYLDTLQQADYLRRSAEAAVNLTSYIAKQLQGGYLPPGTADTGAFANQLFTATNFQVTQQDLAAQAEGNIALNLILIYRAMGGGWQIKLHDNHGPGGTPGPEQGGLTPPAPDQGSQPPAEKTAPENLPPPRRIEELPPPRRASAPEPIPNDRGSPKNQPAIVPTTWEPAQRPEEGQQMFAGRSERTDNTPGTGWTAPGLLK